MSDPEPLDEAKDGAWAGAELLAFTGVAFVGGCVMFPPTKLIQRFRDPLEDGLPWFLVRCVLFLAVLAAATGSLAWQRHRQRRARARATPPPGGPLRLVAVPSAGDCPFCHDRLATHDLGEGVVRCPGCEVSHHLACWREHAGCSTLGCRRDPKQRDALRGRTGE